MDSKVTQYCAIMHHFYPEYSMAYFESSITSLLEAIASKDYIKLNERLWTGNKASRKIFEMETGIKLPATATGTNEALRKYCGENYVAWKNEKDARQHEKEEQRQREKQEEEARLNMELDGFMAGRTKMERVRALKHLTDPRHYYIYHDERFLCIRDWIRKVVEVDKDCEACIFNDTEYFIQYVGEDEITRYCNVTKTAYEYAKHLLARRQA